ncbi:hypothetical protein [Tepidicaulis sp.]|uniref:hypothetical protein n=1 Tax=Tepidicaulis sp. TaxID=1920809 RepID=UPI003B596046
MDQIEHPSVEIWEERRAWFETEFDVEQRGGGYVVGEHATGLLIDLQAAFCAGAFVATIILACTIIDAHLREVELDDRFEGGMKAAFKYSGRVSDLEWLRLRRNALVHFNLSKGPAVTVDGHYCSREVHERDARRAINLVAEVFFETPWV